MREWVIRKDKSDGAWYWTRWGWWARDITEAQRFPLRYLADAERSLMRRGHDITVVLGDS